MVGKLLKYEFKAMGRVLLPASAVVVGFTLLSCFFSPMRTSSSVLSIMGYLLMVAFLLSGAVVLALSYVLCIKRFNDSMFSKEGYMTLSLPVTVMQLLWTKLLVAFCSVLYSFIVVLLCCMLLGVCYGVNFLTQIQSFIELLLSLYGIEGGGVLAYAIFAALVSSIGGLLFVYACLACGQLVNRHRFLLQASVFLFVGQTYSFLWGMLSSGLINLTLKSEADFMAASYLQLTVSLVQSLILGLVSIFFIRYVLKNKVNLLA